jgi:hypothetical protein
VVHAGSIGVPGVSVKLMSPDGIELAETVSDDIGGFLLSPDLLVSKFPRLKVVGEAASTDLPWRVRASQVLPGQARVLLTAQLLDERKRSLTVVVRNVPADAPPHEVVSLVVLYPNGQSYDWRLQVRRLRRRIENLAPGVYSVVASCRGWVASRERVDLIGQLHADVELSLVQARTLSGRLTDAHGQPIGGASVYVEYDPRRGRRHASPGLLFERRASSKLFDGRTCTTGPDGRFRLEGCPRRSLSIEAYAPAGLFLARRDVPDCPTGQESGDLGDLVMRAANGSVRVTYLGEGRRSAVLCGLPSGWLREELGEDGRGRFDRVPPGTYLAFVGSVGSSTVSRVSEHAMVTVEADEEVVVELAPLDRECPHVRR